jgi:hypothetical protein
VHTCLPAVVVTYYAETQTADIQPALKTKYDDGTIASKPIIPSVPVQFLAAGQFSFTFTLKKGDDVFVFFAERSLERWKAETGIIDPKDSRKFHLSDAAFCVPTKGRDVSKISGVSDDKVRLVNGKSEIELGEDGEIIIKSTDNRIKIQNTKTFIDIKTNGDVEVKTTSGTFRVTDSGKFKFQGASDELITVLDELIQAMQNATTLTALGPQPFFPPTLTTLGLLKARLLTLKE